MVTSTMGHGTYLLYIISASDGEAANPPCLFHETEVFVKRLEYSIGTISSLSIPHWWKIS